MGLGQNLESAGPLKTPKNLRLLWISNSALPIDGYTHSWGLRQLDLHDTSVTDAGLAHFKGMPLKLLWIFETSITDLTPLQGMPLEDIRLTSKNITKGLDTLRDMKCLKTIGISWGQT